MLFYVPPLLPVMGRVEDGVYGRVAVEGFAGAVDAARLPIRYLASLFSAGNTELVRTALLKLTAVRCYRRSLADGEGGEDQAQEWLDLAGLTKEQAEAIYRLTALSTLDERFVLPALQREQMLGEAGPASEYRQVCGLGEIR
jgi:nitrate reductase beta subunit